MSKIFAAVDVNFSDDPSIELISVEAEWVYLAALRICKRCESDGTFTPGQLKRECYKLSDLSGPVDELLSTELWMRNEDGTFTVRNWLKWNRSAKDIDEMRKAKASAGARGGRKSAEGRKPKSDGHSSAEASAEVSAEPKTRHDTTPQDTASEETRSTPGVEPRARSEKPGKFRNVEERVDEAMEALKVYYLTSEPRYPSSLPELARCAIIDHPELGIKNLPPFKLRLALLKLARQGATPLRSVPKVDSSASAATEDEKNALYQNEMAQQFAGSHV